MRHHIPFRALPSIGQRARHDGGAPVEAHLNLAALDGELRLPVWDKLTPLFAVQDPPRACVGLHVVIGGQPVQRRQVSLA